MGATPQIIALAIGGIVAVTAVPAAQAAPTTRITIWMDCPGCQIRAVNARDYFSSNGRNDVYNKVATVRGGKATLRVPTAKTTAMAFEVVDTPYGLHGGLPTVALKRKGNQGSWCWAGTSRHRVTLRFSAKRWIDPSSPEAAPEHYNMAVWASPSVATWRDAVNMKRLNDGGLSQQNQPSCESR